MQHPEFSINLTSDIKNLGKVFFIKKIILLLQQFKQQPNKQKMKKSTVILAIAALATMPAVAQQTASLRAADFAGMTPVSHMEVAQMNVPSNQGMRVAAKISSVSDVYGQYEYNVYSQSDGGMVTLSPEFVAGSVANEVLITNCPFSDIDFVATVDAAANVFSIMKSDTGVYNENYGENLMAGPFRLTSDLHVEWLDKLDLTINPDGSIEFPLVGGLPTGIAIYVSDGFFYAYSAPIMQNPEDQETSAFVPIKLVDINLDEWKTYGKGSFTEPILNSLLYAQTGILVEPYDVEVMVNKENKDMFLIVDPYKNDYFNEYGLGSLTPDATGYYLIDASYPDCILVQPLVGSGYGYPMDEAETIIADMLIYNMEAMMVRSGYTPEDVWYEYGANDEECSYKDGNDFYLMHMRFAFDTNPLGVYTWKDTTMLEGHLTLGEAGVEGIEFDENAPVKYYNLQGVEIANPAKGQLVIKTQGSKAQKMIAK